MSPRPTRPVRRIASRPAPAPGPAPSPSPRTTPARLAPTARRSAPPWSPAAARVVSTASVRRFAERARQRRWTAWRRVAGVLAALALAVLVGWVVLVSPVLEVREVRLVGGDRLTVDQVRALAAHDVGTPLARVDTGALADRVGELPVVESVQVLRVWPSTVEVRVAERVPVAAVPTAGGVWLVDSEGVQLATEPEAPADLPLVSADTVAAGERPLQAAAEVLDSLPVALRAQVAGTQALTQDSVTLTLRSSATVVWGSPEDSARKAEVLAVLLQTPAEVYDVSAPGTPVTR